MLDGNSQCKQNDSQEQYIYMLIPQEACLNTSNLSCNMQGIHNVVLL